MCCGIGMNTAVQFGFFVSCVSACFKPVLQFFLDLTHSKVFLSSLCSFPHVPLSRRVCRHGGARSHLPATETRALVSLVAHRTRRGRTRGLVAANKQTSKHHHAFHHSHSSHSFTFIHRKLLNALMFSIFSFVDSFVSSRTFPLDSRMLSTASFH